MKVHAVTVRGGGLPSAVQGVGHGRVRGPHPDVSKRILLRSLPPVLGVGVLALGYGPALAADASADTLSVIVVTANKYRQNIQDVPVSDTVLTSDLLSRANIHDFTGLAGAVPSLTVTAPSQPANNSINIRGIGTYAFSVAAEPSVAVYVDGVPEPYTATAFAALSDVREVEVLNGPQTTLFGKSTTAGLVNITTNDPTDIFTGKLSGLITNDHEENGTLTLSGPLTDRLKARITATYDDYRGPVYDVPERRWVDGHHDDVVRGKLVWSPAESWTVTLEPWYTRVNSTCCEGVLTELSPGATFSKSKLPQSVVLDGVVPGPDNRDAIDDVTGVGDSRDTGAGLTIVHPLGKVTLTSVTSYDRYTQDNLQDTDDTAFDFSTLVPGAPPGGDANGGTFDIRFLTEDLRLTSAPTTALNYVAGLFYSHDDGKQSFVRGSNTLGTLGINPATGKLNTSLPPSLIGTAYAAYTDDATDDNVALYGQTTYQFARHWFATAGLRFNHEHTAYRFNDLGNDLSYGEPACSTATQTPALHDHTCNSDNSETGKFALQFKPLDNLMTYVSYSRGYKGMAYDLTSALTTLSPVATGADKGLPQADVIASDQPVPPETVDDVEVGFKSTLFDDHVRWDVAVFDEVFHDLQAQTRDPYTQLNRLNSIPRVTSRGLESDLNAQAGRLSFDSDVIYDRAVMDEFTNAPCFPDQTAALGCVGGLQDLSGKPMPNAPMWKVTGSARYEIPFAGYRYGAFLETAYRWQSRVLYDLKQDPGSVQEAYGIIDLSVGVDAFDHWTAAVFVNNAFNRNYSDYSGTMGAFNISPYAAPYTDAILSTPGRDSQRYYGFKFSLNF